ncbi:MAG: hypothetical protein Kow0092_30410 [Deferrisomatales bacterium]
MFSSLVVPSDLFSPVSSFPFCLQGAAETGVREVHLVRPLPDPSGSLGAPRLLKQLADAELEEQKRELEALGLRVTLHTPQGEPVEAVLQTAYREKADLLVVSRFSPGLFQEAVVHPLADALLHQSRYPLLGLQCDREGTRCRPWSETFGTHVVFATDFSPCATAAAATAAHIVGTTHAAVTLVHVRDTRGSLSPPASRPADPTQTDRDHLLRLQETLRAAGAREVDVRVEAGRPAKRILGVAADGDASLLLLGTRGLGWAEEVVLGSVAHYVARHADRPVLLVPG